MSLTVTKINIAQKVLENYLQHPFSERPRGKRYKESCLLSGNTREYTLLESHTY